MDVKDLIQEIKKYNPHADFALVEKAYNFAYKAHEGQERKSGEPYIIHPLAMAITLARLRLNSETIAAGLLHDVVDDTPVTIEEIKKEFGEQIAFMVDGVSKLGKIKYRGIEGQAVKLRKMFLAMAQDIRVVLIKLADRLHNLRTLQYLPPAKQKRIAMESLEIYAPLAYRLGMGAMKGRIEDAAFPFAYPEEYKWIASNIKEKFQERENYLERIKAILQTELKKAGVPFTDIHLRAKHYYSLYKKLLRCDMDLNKIYDLIALRIITNSVENCYAALGVVHRLWRPLPGRIKDYIAIPKPNGYQSLHTTVFALEGKITEIQIRTEKIHEEAEYGIAAHWHYSERKGLREYIMTALRFGSRHAATKIPEKELAWVKQLQEWQKETKNPEEFLELLKIDFFGDRIFVFTPQGDVVDLPEGATGIDFAYNIHTDLGNRCAGIKTDGKLVPLSQPLKSGQIVEVMTQKTEKPSRDWLRFAKTSQARSKIKKWFKATDEENLKKIKTEYTEKQVKLQEVPLHKKRDFSPKIEISGQSKIMTSLAKCCQPKTGDRIKGYVTLNRGVSIHKSDCHNLKRIKDQSRFVDVSWKNPEV
jgi:GTP pyrophosphokinase